MMVNQNIVDTGAATMLIALVRVIILIGLVVSNLSHIDYTNIAFNIIVACYVTKQTVYEMYSGNIRLHPRLIWTRANLRG